MRSVVLHGRGSDCTNELQRRLCECKTFGYVEPIDDNAHSGLLTNLFM